MLSLLLACSPEVDPQVPGAVDPDRSSAPGTTTLASRCTSGDPDCLDMLTVPVTWTLEAPWTGMRVGDVGDVNGDGVDDVQITMLSGSTGHVSFLFGPLDREVSLPSGADLGFDGGEWTVGDVTGDGVNDLVRPDGPVLVGPVDDETTEAAASGTVPDGWIGDLDGDGDLDLSAGSIDRVEVWLGSWTGWHTDPPTATLVVDHEPCDPDGSRAQAVPLADLDLDGTAEWWVSAALACPHYQVPANTVGVIDVATTFPQVTWQTPFSVGDQDGDGFDDHSVVNANGPEVLAAPMSFDLATGWSGQSLGALPELDGDAPYPLGRSVIGDAFDDFTIDTADGTLLFEGGGPGSDAFTGTVSRTILGPQISFAAGAVISVDETGARVTPTPSGW